jgi:hypothetical protein
VSILHYSIRLDDEIEDEINNNGQCVAYKVSAYSS